VRAGAQREADLSINLDLRARHALGLGYENNDAHYDLYDYLLRLLSRALITLFYSL